MLLSAVVVARQEDGETLLRPWGVRLAQDLHDLRVREPLGDVTTTAQARPQLRARDVERPRALGNLVHGHVLVPIRQVSHHLEGHHLDTQLVTVLLNGVLRIIGAVPIDALAVLARARVVPSYDEVGGTVVLTDDGVPDRLARPTHPHGQRQEAKDSHAIRVSWQKCLVDTDSGEMVDIAGLGQADNGVDEHVRLLLAGGADSQLAVGAVHRVPRLEGDDSGPAELVEVQPQFSGSICKKSHLGQFITPSPLKDCSRI